MLWLGGRGAVERNYDSNNCRVVWEACCTELGYQLIIFCKSEINHEDVEFVILKISRTPAGIHPAVRHLDTRTLKCLWCYIRLEDFTAVTMKNVAFWDVSPCDSCRSRWWLSTWRWRLLQKPHGDTSQKTTLFVKNGVFWDVTPCDCCKNRRFGGT
jgi:hypothetical protein